MLLSALLLESQLEYLTKKYGSDVDANLIQAAINLNPKMAEKIIYGLKTGVIDHVGDDIIELVSDLDPFKKTVQKTEGHIKYEQLQKRAQEISRPYYQWILKVWKEKGEDFQIDNSIIDFFESNDYDLNDVKDLDYEAALGTSKIWHERIAKIAANTGTLKYGIDTPGTIQAGGFYFVPLHKDDAAVEGKIMQNCVSSYMVQDSRKFIISMRNSKNYPCVDIRIDKGEIAEIKGRQNAIPVPKYQAAIFNWIFKVSNPISDRLTRDFQKITLEHDPKIINKLIDRVVWTIQLQTTFAPYFTQDSADEVFSILVRDNPKVLDELSFDGISGALIYKILSKLENNPKKSVIYAKCISNYKRLPDMTYENWLSIAGSDASCQTMCKSVFNPREAIDDILKIPVSEFSYLYDRYINAIKLLPMQSEALEPYASSITSMVLSSASDSRADSLLYMILNIPTASAIAILDENNTQAWRVFKDYKNKIAGSNNLIDSFEAIGEYEIFKRYILNAEVTDDYYKTTNAYLIKLAIELLNGISRDEMINLYRLKPDFFDEEHKQLRAYLDVIHDAAVGDEEDEIKVARMSTDKETLSTIARGSNLDAATIARKRLNRIRRLGVI